MEGEVAGLPGASEMPGSSEVVLFPVVPRDQFWCEGASRSHSLWAVLTQVTWRKLSVSGFATAEVKCFDAETGYARGAVLGLARPL